MSLILRIALIIVSILTCFFVLRRMRRSQMLIEDTIFWIVASLLLVIISVFPQIASFASRLLGFESPSNFVFLAVIFVLIVKLFSMSVEMSQLKNKLKTLVQEYAIEKNKNEQPTSSADPKE